MMLRARRTGILLLAVLLLFTEGCSLQYLSKFSGSWAAPQLSVDVALTNKTESGICAQDIQTAVPQFSGFNTAKLLNSKIQTVSDDGIAEVKQAAKDLEGYLAENTDRPPVSLYFQSSFDYSENADVLSTRIYNENYTGGAHGFRWIKSYTVNMNTGEFYDTLGSLFQNEESGKKLISDKITAEIKKQPDNYFPEAVQTIEDKNGDFPFYLDGENLIVYFDLYDISCYAAGIPVFKFPLADLKTKVSFNSVSPAGDVLLNGMNLDFNHKVVSNDNGDFLPLDDMAKSISLSVTEDGGKYAIDGKAVQPTIISGVAYMPIQYFNDFLKDSPLKGFVTYDGTVLRIFTQTVQSGEEKKLMRSDVNSVGSEIYLNSADSGSSSDHS
nr:DUF3298 domain-containing protein [uncultured Caproiciproducens sp.]